MNYLLHALMGLILIIFQTAVRPQIGFVAGIYDVLIAYILFLGLFRPLKEALVVVLVFGFVMDSLSGGPFGLFLTAYFWVVLLTRQITRFLHPDNLVLRFFCRGSRCNCPERGLYGGGRCAGKPGLRPRPDPAGGGDAIVLGPWHRVYPGDDFQAVPPGLGKLPGDLLRPRGGLIHWQYRCGNGFPSVSIFKNNRQ